ncbi:MULTISPECIES: hypothetical protein [Oerskovia]|uniref:Uncharacterized protein n=1 Tax=Oerskovia merdavium TaxID=2762227 RepID=A0ABR8U2N0_9CELL|nr:hypothetical protein [Oerskovia merdavium]MBD7982291.1 hypothetical protein [Oerskovia merdavium]
MSVQLDVDRMLQQRQATFDLLDVDSTVQQVSKAEKVPVLDRLMRRCHPAPPCSLSCHTARGRRQRTMHPRLTGQIVIAEVSVAGQSLPFRRRRQQRLGRLTPIEYETIMTTQVALAA